MLQVESGKKKSGGAVRVTIRFIIFITDSFLAHWKTGIRQQLVLNTLRRNMKYYIEKHTEYSFEEAVSRLTDELEKEGFGVLSEINIDEKLKAKLGVDFNRYRILGACNPPNAYKALLSEIHIGVMLPCNVIVRELNDKTAEVAAVDPVASMMAIQNEELAPVAMEIKARLERVIQAL